MKRRSRNEGSIFFRKSKGLWVAKLTLPDRHSKSKYAKDQKTVRDWLVAQQNQLRQGLMPKSDSITVSQFLANYMETVGKHTLRPKTIEAYSYLIRLHIVPTLGRIKLTSLRPDHIQSLYAQTLEKGLSRRTVQFIHSIIHKSLEQAMRWGLVVRNVADLVDPPSPVKRNLTIYSPDQVNRFLASVKDDRFSVLYTLAIYGGFRQGELLGIHVEDCHLDKGIIAVNHAVQYQLGRGVVITEPKTERSRRTVKLPATALTALRSHLKQINTNQGLLFTTSSGKPVSPRFLTKHFKASIKEAGLPEIRFHDLRHTSATLLLLANVNPRVVQERLGHSSVTLTLSTYSHILPAMQDEAAEKMENILRTPSVHLTA